MIWFPLNLLFLGLLPEGLRPSELNSSADLHYVPQAIDRLPHSIEYTVLRLSSVKGAYDAITGYMAREASLHPISENDEAHFRSNGYVNKQNGRVWSEANPQVCVETPLHPEKLTVWCALWAGGILLQKR
ncbi:hypothetical protein TNCV_3111241 [Trichonephila clavipes]|nr:hypothetical protein TNCV_3111241 [Trichonephila clavipes]